MYEFARGCQDKVPQIRVTKIMEPSLQLWRLEAQGQGVGRVGFF